MNKPHKWAELIKAWADGKATQYRDVNENEWIDMGEEFYFSPRHEYRIKPEPKYPETRMSYSDLCESYVDDRKDEPSWHSGAARNLANAAIRRAIEDGDVAIVEKEKKNE